MIALDASALLALLFREAGHEIVEEQLDDCIMTTVNLSEVLSRFARDGKDASQAMELIMRSPIQWIAFDEDLALGAALLYPKTRPLGLSIGDRACLALAMHLQCPALTADRAWKQGDFGVQVQLIR